MKKKVIGQNNLTWISRFWALYNKLPESYKEGFYSLVINISKETVKRGIAKGSVINEGNC